MKRAKGGRGANHRLNVLIGHDDILGLIEQNTL